MTDPRDATFLVRDLPIRVGALCELVQGVLIHSEWLAAYNVSIDPRRMSRDTLPLAHRLSEIHAQSSKPLTVPRHPRDRAVGTCRDYALMLCGLLREQGVPARVRCGFANYLVVDRWEDHWICEYWLQSEARWCRADPQLDPTLRARLDIRFDTCDLPAGAFIAANEAWRACRSTPDQQPRFGHHPASGLWFVRVNVIRDRLSLTGSETSDWDCWRSGVGHCEAVSPADLDATDLIAALPEDAGIAVPIPPWLAI